MKPLALRVASGAFGLALLTWTTACNDCSFFERCDGNVREICGEGADQQVGREVRRVPCEAPNEVCVAPKEDLAVCVAAPAERCDEASFVARCEGEVAIRCARPFGSYGSSDDSWVLAEDCAAEDKTCLVEDGQASCT